MFNTVQTSECTTSVFKTSAFPKIRPLLETGAIYSEQRALVHSNQSGVVVIEIHLSCYQHIIVAQSRDH